MNILVIGGGGREHALVWKLAQSRQASKIYCAPGNAGIASLAECVNIPVTDIERLAGFAREKQIGLTVVGPEVPLCAGIVDVFEAQGLKVFGPTKAGARLEGSKVFSKQFLLKHGVATARAEVFDSAAAAKAYIRATGAPLVVKADGIAAGKGVIVAGTVAEAEQAVVDIMERKLFGAAGNLVIVEECLSGEETSIMAFVDGKTYRLMSPAQDHKRVFDNDAGPNTGGMGAYSPTPAVDASLDKPIREIFNRTLAGIGADGIDFRGVLYAGLMLTENGPMVLEFNTRFGDPETQCVLPRMDFDLAEVMLATAEGRLGSMELKWKQEAAVCIVMASGGYPGDFAKGKVIDGLQAAGDLSNVTVFHAGTKFDAAGCVVTDGGRVLGVTGLGATGLGATIADAVRLAYEGAGKIHFDGAHYRRDIAARALHRLNRT